MYRVAQSLFTFWLGDVSPIESKPVPPNSKRWHIVVCLVVVALSLPLSQGCGGTARVSIDEVAYPVGVRKIGGNAILFLDQDFTHYIYREVLWGKLVEVDLGRELAPQVEAMARRLFDEVFTTEIAPSDTPSLQVILKPTILDTRRPDGESGWMGTDKTTYLKVRWDLMIGTGDTVWTSKITGVGLSKQGGGFKWKAEVGKGMERAAVDMLIKTYEAMSSSEEIRQYLIDRE